MLTVGTVLKNTYRIEKHLSSGGFGNTYLATIIELDDVVAIKEFFISGVAERDRNSNTISVSNSTNQLFFEGQLNKFKKEARRLRKLKHENIVGVHDLFEENGTVYYVMDYIDGESLAARIKRTNSPIGENDAMNYFNQILDALEAVHNMGIWHLDLKPGNIMLDRNGRIKLIDFGASKQQSSSDRSMVTSSAVAYTNGFAPREQMEQNIDKFGPWTDIYALGATLYSLLTTYGPPMPTDIDDDETPDKSRALPMPYVSEKVRKLILWMMQTNRNKRPQSIAQVRAFLNSSDEPLTQISPIKAVNSNTDYQPVEQPKAPAETQDFVQQNEGFSVTPIQTDDYFYEDGQKKNKLFLIIAVSVCLGIAAIWGAMSLFKSSPKDVEESSDLTEERVANESTPLENENGELAKEDIQIKQEGNLEKNVAVGDKNKEDELVKEEKQKKQENNLDKNVAVGSEKKEGADKRGVSSSTVDASSTPRAASVSNENVDNKVYDVAEQQPSFPGGQGALMSWIANNIHYPPVAEENGIQGRVMVSFVVEKNGSISQVQVVRGVEPSLDKEAVRVIKSMPKWTPGKQGGQAVRVKYSLPVSFKLQ